MFLHFVSLLSAMAAQAGPAACPIEDAASEKPGWRAECDAAIKAERDPVAQAVLLFRSAYAYNEASQYFEARDALERAVKLDPANPVAWHELSYTANALGDYDEGERAADTELTLRGDFVATYQERAFSRLYLAKLDGLYADRDKVVTMLPTEAAPLLDRAAAAMWLGRFDRARSDLDSATKLAKGDAGLGKSIAAFHESLVLWTTTSPKGAAGCAWPRDNAALHVPGFIGDCTAAFLAAKSPTRRAEFLTYRSLAWLSAKQDSATATLDRAVAAAIDPGSADAHANLGFAYLDAHHSWAAAREFDRAIAIKVSWAALAGRSAAKYNREDPEGALADAKRSFEIEPNELALTVLGDLAHDRGDDKSAKLYWIGAYHLGSTGDAMRDRLKGIGVEHPEREPREGPKP
ncbi:hypothetical protein IAG41_13030 [Sphingomonas sp. JC676]|uniref:tetratricopeptide repeat protein n=1 Tax=Sphingomonas sp. JC676 TaxID=2768065 RepID=UPI001658356A|nr:tetratricopeptide repeat protein [Sphingomonas sp. JC676]MBC9033313.1 hypothetical protein [Sphingomonas sp. JC676]